MGLPGPNITFVNGQLGQLKDFPDGVFGFLISAEAVSTTFLLNTPYQVRGMRDVAALGIKDTIPNHILYKTLKEFFAEAGDGTEVWFMGMARTTKQSDWFTADGSGVVPAQKLLDTANGKLSMLCAAFSPTGYTVTVTNGLDADVWAAAAAALTFADSYTANKFAPFYVLLDGYAFDGNKTTLKDLNTMTNNRVQVMLGDTETRTGTYASKGTAVGVLAGRKAKSAVQVNPGRVRDGSLSNTKAYILDTPAELYDITALHDKGYVTFRTHTGKSGYYFTDDPLATEPTDDFKYGTHRRVIDKALRIVHSRAINYVLDDLALKADGTLLPVQAKSIETDIIEAIYNGMTAQGELSADPDDPKDRGCICVVDTTHNMYTDNRLKFTTLQVRAKGYSRFIDIPLGFAPVQTS